MDDAALPKLVVARDPGAEAARRIAGWLRHALASQETATLALSGGSTPVPMFRALAADQAVDWERVHVVQVDERVAPDGDPERNAVALQAELPRACHLHLMDVTADDLEEAARAYERLLDELTGGDGLDVVHLGIGDDGHTASWPPGDPVTDVVDRTVVLTGVFNGWRRMTLTVPAVAAATHRLVLVDGADKAPALARWLDGDPTVPVAHVSGPTVVVADGAAAGVG